jgi:outer membrane protein OmpA-like peptidoglycan-associated protein
MEKILCILFYIVFCHSMIGQERQFTLFYENDKYELTESHRTLLDSLNGIQHKENYDIHIKGYTNSIGEKNYNLELSRKRAENVKKELRSFTIISTTGYGALESEEANNRRVDVLIHRKEDHISQINEIIEAPISESADTLSVASLISPKIGDKVILQGIMFYTDQDVIMDESIKALKELVAFLKRHPKIKFKLIGHICCGDINNPFLDLPNVRTGKNDLSEARAKSVYNYLLKNGIERFRMRYFGMAYRNPTGKGDEYDRRVEIEITSVN